MPPTSSIPPYPALDAAFMAALVCYVLALVLTLVRPPWGRVALGLGAGLHLAVTTGRGVVEGFLPLSNKMESFSAAALALAGVTLLAWRPQRAFAVPLVALIVAAMATASMFPGSMSYPMPLLRTAWYPLHVPLSFACYGLWFAAAAAGAAWVRDRDPAWLRAVDRHALQGFALWSVSMVFGGIWGVVAWGAYFMWDPKVIWSVILWFHYASFVHLRLTPSVANRPWVRVGLAWAGALWVLVAYVGTSFFFGRSSHAF